MREKSPHVITLLLEMLHVYPRYNLLQHIYSFLGTLNDVKICLFKVFRATPNQRLKLFTTHFRGFVFSIHKGQSFNIKCFL